MEQSFMNGKSSLGQRTAIFGTWCLVGVVAACSGATESELFATDGTSNTEDADNNTANDGSSNNNNNNVTDAGRKKDTGPGKVDAPIEIVQLDLFSGDKGRINYLLKLRNVSGVEMDRIETLEFGFKGGPSTIFKINCDGNDWKIVPGGTGSVPTFSTIPFAGQTQLAYECKGIKESLPAIPGIQNHGQSPLAFTIRGRMKDGTDWFANTIKTY